MDLKGDIVRFGPNKLICNTATGLHSKFCASNISKEAAQVL